MAPLLLFSNLRDSPGFELTQPYQFFCLSVSIVPHTLPMYRMSTCIFSTSHLPLPNSCSYSVELLSFDLGIRGQHFVCNLLWCSCLFTTFPQRFSLDKGRRNLTRLAGGCTRSSPSGDGSPRRVFSIRRGIWGLNPAGHNQRIILLKKKKKCQKSLLTCASVQ